MPVSNNENQMIDDAYTDLISFDIQSVETLSDRDDTRCEYIGIYPHPL